MNKTKELLNYLNTLYKQVQNNQASKEELQQLLYIVESLSLDISKEEGYIRDKKDSLEKQFEKESIQKLQELEQKQKSGSSISYVQEQMKEMASKIQTFWAEQGFYYVGNVEVDYSGIIEVELGFALRFPSIDPRKKVSGAQKEQSNKHYFRKEGFLFNEKENGFLDCDSNKEKIKNIIQKRFPSSYIRSWESIMSGRNEQKIKRLYIRIPNILDI